MKRFLAMVLTVGFVVSLAVGCGGEEKKAATPAKDKAPAATKDKGAEKDKAPATPATPAKDAKTDK